MKAGQKLTLVYGDFFSVGSNRTQITRYKHVEVQEGDTIDSLCEREIKNDSTALWHVFRGHCEPLGDWNG